ncbi:hypothetical protein BBJ28_00013462 [Nothophytophthora sp. Chile5]|nr:hypothetical protein BBJ28_00013462 [Nothophytophthora sp. Chile5]
MPHNRLSGRSVASTGSSIADTASPYTTGRRNAPSNGNPSQKSTRRLTQRPGPVTERSIAICSTAQLALQDFLGAVHVEVVDVSCARLQYKLLGTKRYWHRSIKQEKQGKIRWEVKLYQICGRRSTIESLLSCTWHSMPRLANDDVTLTSVGFFDTEKAAMTALEAAIKARDATNPFTGLNIRQSELPIELVKYFQVVVVSDRFQRKSQTERLEMIYSRLLEMPSSSANAQEETETWAVFQQAPTLQPSTNSQLRGFSYVGAQVIALPMWRSLLCHFSVCAKTPAQWKAGRSRQATERSFTERFGPSHLANDRAFNVDASLLPVSRGLGDLVSRNQEDPNGRHKTESVPHFYHGLPDEVKRMIAEEQAKTDAPRADSLAFQKLAKNTEGSFVKKYLKRRREYLHVALKLQRLYRNNMHSKASRRCFLRQLGALTLQRLFRGHQRRRFAKMYYRVITCATLIIQSVYRSYLSRQATKALRARMQWAALTLQRVFRGFVARKFVRWMRQLQANAIVLERAVRGFMGRCRVQRLRVAKHKQCVLLPAAKHIQRVWRGHQERKMVAAKREARERLQVRQPAAQRIEKLMRGYLARRQVKKFRLNVEAARRIQKFWRSYRYIKKWMDLMDLRRMDRMASYIGAIGRGFVARKFVLRERRKRHFQYVVEPSAAHIQRVFRGYMVRKRLEDLRDRVEAAITLQEMWRSRSTVKTIREKLRGFRLSIREAAAAKLQHCYQCYRARQELTFRRLSHQACYGKAALAVQAAWRSYCSRQQLKEFRFCSLLERKAVALTQAKDDREMIEFDMFDARADLKRVVKYKAKTLRRIKELKDTRIEWERRQPVVEKELSQLTEEDLDRGWGEAFETEKHILHFSLELSVEDLLSKKQQVREYEAEIEDLRLELEDLERDLEDCILKETEELETYRELELHHAHTLFTDEKSRKHRLQRIRWGIRNVRKRVILRERQDLKLLEKELLAKRQVEELGVLAFEKKQYIQRKLEQAIEAAAQSRAKQNEVMLELNCHTNVRQGFDEAVQRMQTITNEHSFHYRLPKTDLREDVDSPICSNCGRITCDCHLRANESAIPEDEHASKKVEMANTIPNKRSRDRLARRWRYQD